MKWVEQAGLVKFDFLGLKTLTVLRRAVELIRRRGIEVDLVGTSARRPEDLRAASAAARRSACSRWKAPACARRWSRWRPTASRTSSRSSRSIARARWRTSRSIARASSARTSTPEQLVSPPQAGADPARDLRHHRLPGAGDGGRQELSGYSLGDADLLRRAMGKKIKAEMDAQRDRFVKGAVERASTRAIANEIFDLLAKFADYGFNKSHAAAYALVAFQTAYLKANHPVEFLAASMTMDLDNTDKLSEFRREAQRLGIRGRAALDQPLRRRVRRGLRPGAAAVHPLCARRHQGRRPAGRSKRSSRRAATKPFRISPTSPAASTRASSTSARSRP